MTMESFLDYEVKPCANVPEGLPRQRLAVLSPVWEEKSLLLEYADGTLHLLQGWSGPEPGRPCSLRVFWTRHRPGGPAVCLAVGGDHGLRVRDSRAIQGHPFLALAESLIPPEVLAVIGPPPPRDQEVLLLA